MSIATAPSPRAAVVRRNVRLLTAYEAFAGLMPFLAVWVVYLTDFRDLTLAQVGIMEGVFWGIKVLAEMPTGAFADRFGRKLTFIVGAVIEGLGILTFAFAGGFVLLLGSYILWAGGGAFRSGNTEAFLYDTLAEVDETADYARVAGRLGAIAGVAGLFGVAIGGVIAGVINLQVAMLTGVIPYVLALAVLLPMVEPRRSGSLHEISYVETLTGAIRALRDHPAVRYIILFEVTISTIFIASFLLLQPFFGAHGVPIGWFGILLIPHRLGSSLGSYFAYRIDRALGLRAHLGWAIVAAVLGVGVMAVVDSIWAFAGLVLMAPLLSSLFPATRAYVNDRTESNIRATVLSFAPLGQAVAFAIAATALGLIADIDLRLGFAVSAASVGLTSGAMYLLWLRADRAEVAADAASTAAR